MGTEVAVSLAVDLLVAYLNNAAAISQAIQEATAAGSTTLSVDQWANITSNDDIAEAKLAGDIVAGVKG